MSESPQSSADRSAQSSEFYLPATSPPQSLSRVEAVLSDLFGGHGVVPIPDSYNE